MEVPMFSKNDSLALEIKNKILTNFIQANIEIVYDKEQNEYFISTRNKDLYYSEAYGLFTLEISQGLWEQGIFNFHFILDVKPSQFEDMEKCMSFDVKEMATFTSWRTLAYPRSSVKYAIDNYTLLVA
jgi:hypothetical protein